MQSAVAGTARQDVPRLATFVDATIKTAQKVGKIAKEKGPV